MNKNIFQSKTFWFNVLSGIALFSGAVPANKYSALIDAGVNIGLRLLTNQAVNILPESPRL